MKEFGSVAERSKALISGSSHFDGVGSNPTAATIVFKKNFASTCRKLVVVQLQSLLKLGIDVSYYGSVAEWSKALVLGTSHFDGVGSNPTTARQ